LCKALIHGIDFGFREPLSASGFRFRATWPRAQIDIGFDVGYIDKTIGKQWLQETQQIATLSVTRIPA
jgi:hypothetical protein